MRLTHKILFIVILSSNAIFSRAQDKWTLDACLEYALDNNLELNSIAYIIDSNEETYHQSRREFLPTVSANLDYSLQFGRSVDPNTNQIIRSTFFGNNYSINASQDLFRGFQRSNTIKATDLLLKASQEEILQEKYLLAFRVMTAFYDVQFFNGLLEISKEQVDLSLDNYNLVKRQVELGVKAGTDLYQAEAKMISDQLLVTQSENNLQAAKLALIQEMNYESSAEMLLDFDEDIDKTNEAVMVVDADSVYREAVDFIPLLKSQAFLIEAAKLDIEIAKGQLLPTLALYAGFSTGFFDTNVDNAGKVIPYFTQIKDNSSQYIGLTLGIPIIDRGSNRSLIKQQKIALQQTANSLNIQKQELRKAIQELVLSYEATRNELIQTQQNEESQLLNFQISQKRYDNGLVSLLELYQVKNIYVKAQNENLRVLSKLKVLRKTIDFYKGLFVFDIYNIK